MATIVHFTQKNGQKSSATFPTRALAESYARGVKSPTLTDTDAAVAQVQVQVCKVADFDTQRQATKAYYKSVKEPTGGIPVVHAPMCAEQRAERKAEHFMEARITGQSMSDAQNDWDSLQSDM